MKNTFLVFIFYLLVSTASAQFAVLELFTSEGSAACPPAEELLNKIGKEAEAKGWKVYPLAYHVDYWNKLGWNDPYSKRSYTTRQENYSRVLPGKELYTPQLVVNGTRDCTGSKEKEVRQLMEQALANKETAELTATIDSIGSDTIYVRYNSSASGVNYAMRFVITENGLTSAVTKGENAGKKLSHDHVVRVFSSLDSPAANGQYKFPLKGFSFNERSRLTVFLQEKRTMRIVAAGRALR